MELKETKEIRGTLQISVLILASSNILCSLWDCSEFMIFIISIILIFHRRKFSSAALDMQQCGISTEGAMAFQPVLKFNSTIYVLDLRLNPLIGKCKL